MCFWVGDCVNNALIVFGTGMLTPLQALQVTNLSCSAIINYASNDLEPGIGRPVRNTCFHLRRPRSQHKKGLSFSYNVATGARRIQT